MSPHPEKTLTTRVTVIETQLERIVSDIESEKGTRSRINSEHDRKVDALTTAQDRTNRILYSMLGGFAVIQVLLQFIRK